MAVAKDCYFYVINFNDFAPPLEPSLQVTVKAFDDPPSAGLAESPHPLDAKREGQILRLLVAAYGFELKRSAKEMTGRREAEPIPISGLGRNSIVLRLRGTATHKLQPMSAKQLSGGFRAIEQQSPRRLFCGIC